MTEKEIINLVIKEVRQATHMLRTIPTDTLGRDEAYIVIDAYCRILSIINDER